MMIRKIHKYIILTLMLILIIFCSTSLIFLVLSNYFSNNYDIVTVFVSLLDVVTAIVAVVFILYQLEIEKNIRINDKNITKAQFILEYNKSFLENEKMVMVEHYLETFITGDSKNEIKNIKQNRQLFVDYLVYLEGLASCVLNGILEIRDIDDLFAYRFFLALNNEELQRLELEPFEPYYRGCYQLYEVWFNYRVNCGKYLENENYAIPLYDNRFNLKPKYIDTIKKYKKVKGKNEHSRY